MSKTAHKIKQSKEVQPGLFHTIRFLPGEREAFKKKDRRPSRIWAEEAIYVVKSKITGKFRAKNNPSAAKLLDLLDLPYVRRYAIKKGVQTGISLIVTIFLFRRKTLSSNNSMKIMADRDKIKQVAKTRDIPMLKASPGMKGLLSENPDDTSQLLVQFRNGSTLIMAWAGSESSVSSDPCEDIAADELNKYAKLINLEEIKDRTTTYEHTSKQIFFSTPSVPEGPIETEYEDCDVHADYHMPCPDCGYVQIMTYDRFVYPECDNHPEKEADRKKLANKIERKRLARYKCKNEECGSLWDDQKRNEAAEDGEWLFQEDIERPLSIGIHHPSWISTFKSLSSVVARKLRAEGHPEREQKWENNEGANDYIYEQSERKEEPVLALRDDRPRGLVPKEAADLLLIADTQQDSFQYEIRAVGYGPDKESWQIREGEVSSFAALRQMAYDDEYKDVDGNVYKIGIAFIDSGGGVGKTPKHSRTAEVYTFCKQNPLFHPLKGRRTMTKPWTTSKIENYPGTNTPIPGGLTLYLLNVTHFKNQLSRKLNIKPDDSGAWHLHKDATVDYAKQMCAEYQDERGFWQCPKGKDNHQWDCGTYFLAGIDIIGVEYWATPEETAAIEEEEERQQQTKATKPKNKRGRRW